MEINFPHNYHFIVINDQLSAHVHHNEIWVQYITRGWKFWRVGP